MDFMNREWWTLFVNEWNESPECRRLAGLGAVGFEVYDSQHGTICVEWDSNGQARLLPQQPDGLIMFRASEQAWNAFFQSQFRAVIGVLSKKLSYEGPMARIMPYAAAFDVIPSVVRRLNDSFTPV